MPWPSQLEPWGFKIYNERVGMEHCMAGPSYAYRSSVFSRERTFELGPDALSWKDERGTGSIKYADIERVHIYRVTTPFGPAIRRCVLHSRAGQKITIQSVHYVRLAKTEDRIGTYGPFVRELTARVATRNPHAKFYAGLGKGYLTAYWIILVVGPIVIVTTLLTLFVGGSTNPNIVPLVIFLIFLPAAWTTVRQGRARLIDPKTISGELVSG